MQKEEIKKSVRLGYALVAKGGGSCCGAQSGCCGTDVVRQISKGIGYTDKDIEAVPDGANLGLGCGNPVALASLKEGEVVLDLGSGAGFDAFLAAQRVGQRGKIIGVDMTPEMLEKARENAMKGDYQNVEFRLGEIENLPVADNSVDIIISNCAINLSPDKGRVFKEAYRVLKHGGRLMVSDIVLLEKLPVAVQQSVAAYVGCMAGASLKMEYLDEIKKAGFKDIKVVDETGFDIDFIISDPTAQAIINNDSISERDVKKAGETVRSVKISAVKR